MSGAGTCRGTTPCPCTDGRADPSELTTDSPLQTPLQEYLKDNELPENASASELIGALRELYAMR